MSNLRLGDDTWPWLDPCSWERRAVCLAAVLLAACSVRQAPVPKLAGANAEQAYAQYKLELDDGLFSMTWKRADGEYQWPQLRELAEQYPESRAVRQSANTRGFVLGSIGGAGGGLVGYTLGWNLAADASRRMSSDTQVALYATGGGLVAISIILGIAWHNPAKDFADVYNLALRNEIAKGSAHGAGRTAWFVPRPIEGGYGWVF